MSATLSLAPWGIQCVLVLDDDMVMVVMEVALELVVVMKDAAKCSKEYMNVIVKKNSEVFEKRRERSKKDPREPRET
jgi:hypothetical protein